ncbi:MAG: amidohydrolase family protein [Bryobacterales bacterium]|nr:amidohydrolase family protein [Bryobacterales bacterium]
MDQAVHTLLVVLALAAISTAAQVSPPASDIKSSSRIDSHVHVAPPPDLFLKMLERLNLRLVNVTLIDPHAPGYDKTEPQTSIVSKLTGESRGRIGWASTFDPAGFEGAGFAETTIAHLQSTFDKGAVAVKIYKSIGLDLKNKSGAYVMPDEPAFAPVLEMIAAQNRTVLAHLAEPKSSWQPLNPEDPHYGYYKANPGWHMHLHPERPSYESIIAARDRMLAAHPKLRVIGCHLGSMEHDVEEIATRLDRYPNFAVDTAARVVNLMLQPREKVRAFLIRYQDRVLWGTDMMELAWEKPDAAVHRWETAYAREWKYFSTAETLTAGGRRVQGLELPPEILRKIFHDNALRWIPGLKNASCCGGLPVD